MNKKLYFNSTDISNLEKENRAHFINSLGGFKSVALVGTSDKEKNTNVAIFSSIFHVGANPPLIGLVFRPNPLVRDTLRNILQTGFYTINHINESIFSAAHQTSARYDAAVSEFEMTGLNKEYKNDFFAPYVTESNVQLGIAYKEKVDITTNNTVLIIGEIIQVYILNECLNEDGFVNLEKANTLTCSGLDSYHKTVQMDRLSYAKPNKKLTSIL